MKHLFAYGFCALAIYSALAGCTKPDEKSTTPPSSGGGPAKTEQEVAGPVMPEPEKIAPLPTPSPFKGARPTPTKMINKMTKSK